MQRRFSPVVGRGQGLTGRDGGHLSRASSFGPSALLLFLLLAQGRADSMKGEMKQVRTVPGCNSLNSKPFKS